MEDHELKKLKINKNTKYRYLSQVTAKIYILIGINQIDSIYFVVVYNCENFNQILRKKN